MVLTHTCESAGLLKNIKVNGQTRAAKLSGILFTWWHVALVNWTFQLTDGCISPAPPCPHSHHHPSPPCKKLLHVLPQLLFSASRLHLSYWLVSLSFLGLACSFLLSAFILLLPRRVPLFLVSGVLQIWLLLADISHSVIHCPAWSLCCSGLSHNYRQVCLWTRFGCPWYFHAPGRPCPLLHWSKEGFGCPVVSC